MAKLDTVSLHDCCSQNEGPSVQGSEASYWACTTTYNQTRGRWVGSCIIIYTHVSVGCHHLLHIHTLYTQTAQVRPIGLAAVLRNITFTRVSMHTLYAVYAEFITWIFHVKCVHNNLCHHEGVLHIVAVLKIVGSPYLKQYCFRHWLQSYRESQGKILIGVNYYRDKSDDTAFCLGLWSFRIIYLFCHVICL